MPVGGLGVSTEHCQTPGSPHTKKIITLERQMRRAEEDWGSEGLPLEQTKTAAGVCRSGFFFFF